MKEAKIFLLIIFLGFFFCSANQATAVVINITDVNIIPDEPNEEDVITIFVSGSASQAYSIVEYSDFSKVGTSLQLDIFIDVGIYDIISTWTHSEEIGPLPPGTYTLTTRIFYVPTGDLKDTHITEFTVVPDPVCAEIDVVPHTLNLSSKGKWLTCHIWLPEGYNVAEIEPNSIRLEETIAADWLWFDEEEQVVMAKFKRSEVQDILSVGEVELTVTGQLLNGTKFEGMDVIRVIGKARVNSNSKVEYGIEYYIQTDKSVYTLGENVQMLYRVTNLRDESVLFLFPVGPVTDRCDFMVEKGGDRIWDNLDRGVLLTVTSFTLSPSGSRSFQWSWDMTDLNGSQILPGNYDVTGALSPLAPGYQDKYVPVSVEIKIIRKPAD